MVVEFRHLTVATASANRAISPGDFNRKWQHAGLVASHIRRICTLRIGTTLADVRMLAASESEGRTRMPFARLHLGKLLGGVLLAPALGSLCPAAAQSTASYSGTYIGTTQLESGSSQVTPGDDPMCAPGGDVTLKIQDGRFNFPWNAPDAFHVRIADDGSFYAITGSPLALSGKRPMIVPTMQGHVSGAALQADYGTRWCRYHLNVTRS